MYEKMTKGQILARVIQSNTKSIVIPARSRILKECSIDNTLLQKKFGVNFLDRLLTPSGMGTVVGAEKTPSGDYLLWFWVDGQDGISFWDNIVDAQSLQKEWPDRFFVVNNNNVNYSLIAKAVFDPQQIPKDQIDEQRYGFQVRLDRLEERPNPFMVPVVRHETLDQLINKNALERANALYQFCSDRTSSSLWKTNLFPKFISLFSNPPEDAKLVLIKLCSNYRLLSNLFGLFKGYFQSQADTNFLKFIDSLKFTSIEQAQILLGGGAEISFVDTGLSAFFFNCLENAEAAKIIRGQQSFIKCLENDQSEYTIEELVGNHFFKQLTFLEKLDLFFLILRKQSTLIHSGIWNEWLDFLSNSNTITNGLYENERKELIKRFQNPIDLGNLVRFFDQRSNGKAKTGLGKFLSYFDNDEPKLYRFIESFHFSAKEKLQILLSLKGKISFKKTGFKQLLYSCMDDQAIWKSPRNQDYIYLILDHDSDNGIEILPDIFTTPKLFKSLPLKERLSLLRELTGLYRHLLDKKDFLLRFSANIFREFIRVRDSVTGEDRKFIIDYFYSNIEHFLSLLNGYFKTSPPQYFFSEFAESLSLTPLEKAEILLSLKTKISFAETGLDAFVLACVKDPEAGEKLCSNSILSIFKQDTDLGKRIVPALLVKNEYFDALSLLDRMLLLSGFFSTPGIYPAAYLKKILCEIFPVYMSLSVPRSPAAKTLMLTYLKQADAVSLAAVAFKKLYEGKSREYFIKFLDSFNFSRLEMAEILSGLEDVKISFEDTAFDEIFFACLADPEASAHLRKDGKSFLKILDNDSGQGGDLVSKLIINPGYFQRLTSSEQIELLMLIKEKHNGLVRDPQLRERLITILSDKDIQAELSKENLDLSALLFPAGIDPVIKNEFFLTALIDPRFSQILSTNEISDIFWKVAGKSPNDLIEMIRQSNPQLITTKFLHHARTALFLLHTYCSKINNDFLSEDQIAVAFDNLEMDASFSKGLELNFCLSRIESASTVCEKAALIVRFKYIENFRSWLKQNESQLREVFLDGDAVKLLREGNAISVLIQFLSEKTIETILLSDARKLFKNAELARLVKQFKPTLGNQHRIDPLFRELILSLFKDRTAKALIASPLTSLLFPTDDTGARSYSDKDFSLQLLHNPAYRGFITPLERKEILDYWMKKEKTFTFFLLSNASDQSNLKPEEYLDLLLPQLGNTKFLRDLRGSESFKKVVIPLILDDPTAAARLLSSSLAADKEFISSAQITEAITTHGDNEDFSEHLTPIFYRKFHPLASVLRTENPSLYSRKLYNQALVDTRVAEVALRQHAIRMTQEAKLERMKKRLSQAKWRNDHTISQQDIDNYELHLQQRDRFTSAEVATLLNWHGNSFLEKIGSRVLNLCTYFILNEKTVPGAERNQANAANPRAANQVILIPKDNEGNEHQPAGKENKPKIIVPEPRVQLQHNPELIRRVDSQIRPKLKMATKKSIESALGDYRGKPLTYAMLRQSLEIWRSWHSGFSTVLKVGRWFKPEGMPQTLLDIEQLLKKIPKNVDPHSEVSNDIRLALDVILADREQRNSASTRNEKSHTSQIVTALLETTTLDTSSNTEGLDPKNFEEFFKNILEIYKKTWETKIGSSKFRANQVLNTVQLLINAVIQDKDSESEEFNLKKFFNNNPGSCWWPPRRTDGDYCPIHFEETKLGNWNDIQVYYTKFVSEFILVFTRYQHAGKLQEFFERMDDPFHACVEGRLTPIFIGAVGLKRSETYKPELCEFMDKSLAKAHAYLRVMGHEDSLSNLRNFFIKRCLNKPVEMDEPKFRRLYGIREEENLPVGFQKDTKVINREIIDWYLHRVATENIDQPVLKA